MKYLIVGGVGGGATVAARLRRMDEQATIILFEKGKYISYANCGLPYYIGDTISERNALFLQTPTSFGNRFDVEVRVETEVTAIHRADKTVVCRHVSTGKTYEERYDKLVLSPGTVAIRPHIPGVDGGNIFTLKDVADTDAIKAFLLEQKQQVETPKAVVVGAGFIGLEMVENLHQLGCSVTIVEKAAHVMPIVDVEIAGVVQQHLRQKGVTVITKNAVAKIEEVNQHSIITLEDGQQLQADFILLSIGVKPQTNLAVSAGLAIGETGGIVVNAYLQTSDPDIYAVGDAVETTHPLTGKPQSCFLAAPTNKQARLCADNIVEGNQHPYCGTVGTAIAKVFDLTIGVTGLTEQKIKQLQLPYATSITHTASHATYYPGSATTSIKLQFHPTTGQLLGAEMVGKEGVDKRLDVLAHTLAQQGTIADLITYDHAYAPPFSSPKDAVTVAGCVAENILTGKVKMIQWHELRAMLARKAEEEFLLLDVRSFLEHRAGAIEHSELCPLDELREALDDFPRDQPIVIYCAVGLRGYLAARILQQNGFTDVRNLAGGFTTWSVCQ